MPAAKASSCCTSQVARTEYILWVACLVTCDHLICQNCGQCYDARHCSPTRFLHARQLILPTHWGLTHLVCWILGTNHWAPQHPLVLWRWHRDATSPEGPAQPCLVLLSLSMAICSLATNMAICSLAARVSICSLARMILSVCCSHAHFFGESRLQLTTCEHCLSSRKVFRQGTATGQEHC